MNKRANKQISFSRGEIEGKTTNTRGAKTAEVSQWRKRKSSATRHGDGCEIIGETIAKTDKRLCSGAQRGAASERDVSMQALRRPAQDRQTSRKRSAAQTACAQKRKRASDARRRGRERETENQEQKKERQTDRQTDGKNDKLKEKLEKN
jgi:hypothetical protein